ncbi:deoxyuridine 5'-triphosphate nucleotidohydrolase-like isoform X3 [Anguilla anguilla]|uniref:Deoxyuridine 5'-triphosphate nucleotidohydrolase n=1 Tax=Anguilla anguilla TaxID=7936 RepID=A0A9D3RYZ8_ANGAN|nr:deoxyuridine 5'-triphosphate nucleotidohydrolase-like isoform X3 [Anguilla anguilla]KAG5848999.1 hypothetical protein ANANG_G00105410 [Anguilla anguilla]
MRSKGWLIHFSYSDFKLRQFGARPLPFGASPGARKCWSKMALLVMKPYFFRSSSSLRVILSSLHRGLTFHLPKMFIEQQRDVFYAAINMPCSEVTQATASSPVKGLKTGPEELKVVLKFAKLTENATVPTKGSAKSAGYDLYSAYDYSVAPMDKVVVKTDIQIAVPTGCYGRVAPRSGLAAKYFIDVGAGVVDEDYRGNVGVVLFNFSKETFEVKKGDRVAQLICEKICYPELEEHKTLDETVRGAGGFGSTGKN